MNPSMMHVLLYAASLCGGMPAVPLRASARPRSLPVRDRSRAVHVITTPPLGKRARRRKKGKKA